MISNPDSVLAERDRRTPFAVGGRLGLRNAARQLLLTLRDLPPEDLAALGWAVMEVEILEQLAVMPIHGVSFGKWETHESDG